MTSERGNVLFLILIAVALFAALSYAVTSSQRTSEDTGSGDKARLKATEIIQFATAIQNAVLRLKMSGCDDTQLSFYHASQSTGYEYDNPNSPGNHRCDIFHPSGGNISYRKAGGDINYYYWSAGDMLGGIGTSTRPEILMTVGLRDARICEAINKGLGLASPETSGYTNQFMGTDYRGVFNNYYTLHGGTSSPLHAVSSACLKSLAGGRPESWGSTYFYYHVIVAR